MAVEPRVEPASTKAAARADARRRLLGALERFDQRQPNIPWTFCLSARLLIADGNLQGASLGVGLCEERCDDPACQEQVRRLRSQIAKP